MGRESSPPRVPVDGPISNMAQNITYETKLGQPSPEAQALPFFNLLPKDRPGLLRARIAIRERCIEDEEFRDAIWQMCRHDLAFFATVFCWIHETREGEFAGVVGKFPFFPWADQVDLLAWLQKHIGRTDIHWQKTRGIGASWLTAITMLWLWLTKENISLAVLSVDETRVDVKNQPGSFLGKLDLLFANLPYWMTHTADGQSILSRTTKNHKFENLANGTMLRGFVPTDDKLRGDRFYCLLADEAAFLPNDAQRWLAATQYTSPSRVWVSTHNGTACMFYRLSVDSESRLVRISNFWWNNPARAAGLYVSRTGRIEILDMNYQFSGSDYPFSHEDPGTLRSPWYDAEFLRPGVSKAAVKEELDGLAAVQSRKLYQPSLMRSLESHIRPPAFIGTYDFRDNKFVEDLEHGDWKFWRDPEYQPGGQTFLGVDPSLGGGAYSAVAAIDGHTGELFGVYSGHDAPIDLARLVSAVGKLLAGPGRFCVVNWEVTGIGGVFTNELVRLKYPRLHEGENGRQGYHNRDRGQEILVELGRGVRDSELVVYSQDVVQEAEQFEHDLGDNLVYAGIDGHGDRIMASAIAWSAARKYRRNRLATNRAQQRIIQKRGPDAEPLVVARNRRADLWSSSVGVAVDGNQHRNW